jgi:N-acetylneuraminate lyase
MQSFQGIWPALITPFTTENQVNTSVLRALVDYLLGKGVDGFYVCGTTGEGVLMSRDERMLVAATVLQQVDGRCPVIVHVGGMVAVDAVALARHAQEHGAAGISSIIPPGYQHPDHLQTYFETVARAAPELPFLPYLINVQIDAVAFVKRLLYIPNLAGTKYTGPNIFEMRRLVEMGAQREHWSVFSGMDEQSIFAAMFGSCGHIGSTLNFMSGAYQRIRGCYEASDVLQARDWQLKANQVTQVLAEVGFESTLKHIMSELLGQDCGLSRLRGAPLTADERSQLHAGLAQTHFSELTAL